MNSGFQLKGCGGKTGRARHSVSAAGCQNQKRRARSDAPYQQLAKVHYFQTANCSANASAIRRNRSCQLGFTLLELMVVLVLMAIMAAMIVPEMRGTYENALLRSTSRDLVSVLNLAYSRAVSINQVHRVRLEPSSGKYFVEARVRGPERTSDFIPIQNISGSEGKLDQRISIQIRDSAEDVSETPPLPSLSNAGIDSRTIQDANTISFYPDGTADRRDIQLQDREGFRLSLQINPITARVRIVEPAPY